MLMSTFGNSSSHGGANHSTQWLTPQEASRSQLAEFRQSLEGPAAQWFAKQPLTDFADFKEFCSKFKQRFHRPTAANEATRDLYNAQQEEHEFVNEFVVRFDNLLDLLPTRDHPWEATLKDAFLASLWESLQTTLKVINFNQSSLENVLVKALEVGEEIPHKETLVSPSRERGAQRALQCTRCSDSGHTALNWPRRCDKCDLKAHFTTKYEYNLLSKAATVNISKLDAAREDHDEPGPSNFHNSRQWNT
jgi:hypothetical protein